MSRQLGERLFTFAVVTDTHLNQGETECNSPFEVNRLANARMRHVVRDLNRRDLAFVIHLGDLLHPVPAIPHLYERAAHQFKTQTQALRHTLYLIPGNHDVGDKPIEWGPVGVVRDEYLKLWRKHFGANYQAFTHGDCRFITIDAQIVNSGLALEAEQAAWLEAELKTHAGKRLFINTHYPPYLTTREEDEHYDNLGEPGRSWLLALLESYNVEALFAGHVHNFWYYRHAKTDCYLLPSTAFVRQDYAEMYRMVPPAEMEAGRNDIAKLGYFLVHVHRHGHVCEVVRTYGATASEDTPPTAQPKAVQPVHPLLNPLDRFGFDMRQNWLEIVEIPPSGGLDEFDRKRVRNDYGLLALLDMGVNRIRIPARDLLDPEHRARLAHCAALGIRCTLFSFGVPSPELSRAIMSASALIDIWEIAGVYDRLPEIVAAAASCTRDANVALYVSKLRSKDEMERGGEKYYHMINHGFTLDDTEQLNALANIEVIAGAVFRVPGDAKPWLTANAIAAACAVSKLRASLHIRMSVGNPGSRQEDDAWVCERSLEALLASAAHPNVHAYLDAFTDLDRGYFTRRGVLDRLYNPRPAYHAIRTLLGVLAHETKFELASATRPAVRDTNGAIYSLIADDTLPDTGKLVSLRTGVEYEAARLPASPPTGPWLHSKRR